MVFLFAYIYISALIGRRDVGNIVESSGSPLFALALRTYAALLDHTAYAFKL